MILCIGEPMVEFVRLDDDATGALYRRGIGGDTSNAAIAAARQGARVGYLTALGADAFGDAVMQAWRAEGIETDHVIRSEEAPTGVYFIDPDPEGRAFTYYRDGSAASRLHPSDLPDAAFDDLAVLHLSGITLAVSEDLRETALSAIFRAADRGAAVSFDTNLRLKLWTIDEARAAIFDAIRHASIAVTSVDDNTALTGLSEPADIAAHYHAMGPEIVLVTNGAEGCLLSTGDRAEVIPSAPAVPVDSTGAGDSFAGGFLAWFQETGDPFEAAHRAAIVAAGTVSGFGAVAPIPHRADVLAARNRD